MAAVISLSVEIGNVSNTADGVDDEKDHLVLLVSFCVEPVAVNQQGEMFNVSCTLRKKISDGTLKSIPQQRSVVLEVVEPSLTLNVNATPL